MGKKILVIGLIILAFMTVIILLTKRKKNNAAIAEFEAPPTARLGDTITLTSKTKGAKTWDWDFGDDDTHSSLEAPKHSYKEAGNYVITLIVNGKDKVTRNITVTGPVTTGVDNSGDAIASNIKGPSTATVGIPVTFTDQTPGAKNQKWDFGDDHFGTGATVTHSYENSGVHMVKLTNDKGGLNQALKKVMVSKPAVASGGGGGGAAPPPIQIPTISDQDLLKKLQTVAYDPNQYSPIMTELRKYVDNLSIPVVVNNGSQELFGDFCTRIQIEKTKIKAVRKERNTNGYISKIYIVQ